MSVEIAKNNLLNEEKIINLVSEALFMIKEFKQINNEDNQQIITQRNLIEAKTQELKSASYNIYGAIVGDYIIAAIIYFADEKIYESINTKWHPFQKELLDCNNGGEHFFTICQQTIDNPSSAMILFKTLYLLLCNDFKGMYFNEPSKRGIFKQRLYFHIENHDSYINSTKEQISLNPKLKIATNKWLARFNSRYLKNLTIALIGVSAITYLSIVGILLI